MKSLIGQGLIVGCSVLLGGLVFSSVGEAKGSEIRASATVVTSAGPIANEIPHELKALGDSRQDPYFWLRGKEKPEVIKHLKAENAHFERTMQPYDKLRKSLFKELKSHIQEEEVSYPIFKDNYHYFSKMLKGKEYPQLFRKFAGKTTPAPREQMILDVNSLNPGGSYTRIAANVVSDDGKIMAYALDIKGDRIFKIYFKDLTTGKLLKDVVESSTGDIAWAADNRTIFYGGYEPVTLRQRYVYRHTLGEKKDVLIYDEKDEKFNVDVRRGLSKKFIFLEAQIGRASCRERV